jgi:hypothetical protein
MVGGSIGNVRQRRTVFAVGDGFGNENFFKAGQAHDIAGMRFRNLNALHAFEVVNHRYLPARNFAVAMAANRGITHFDFSLVNFTKRNSPEVIAVIQIGDEHLESVTGARARGRDMFGNGVKQRLHRGAVIGQVQFGVARFGGAINEGEIQLLVRGIQRNEKLEDLVQDFFRIRILTVNFVDDNNRLGARFQRFTQDEPGLRLRTFGGIHDQQHAVNHVHDAFDFAAKIRVAGGVHDINVVVLVFEGGVLGANGDAFFTLQIHGIHEAFGRRLDLVGAEGAGLLEEAIHEGGLAVVNVRDDGDITNMLHFITF